MALITRSTLPDAFVLGIRAFYGNNYRKLPKQWPMIFDRVPSSSRAFEEFVEIYGMGLAPPKPEGSSIQYDTVGQGPKTIMSYVVYGLGYALTREHVEDNQYEQVARSYSQMLARSMQMTEETVHANILNRAFSTTQLMGDGKPLVASDHLAVGGTYSNLLTASDLSEAALEDALTRVSALKDARGHPIAARAVQLIIHPSNRYNAIRLLEGMGRPGTANNDINAIRESGDAPRIVENHFLTDEDAWFIQTDVPEGFKSMWKRMPRLEEDSEFNTENLRFKSTMRFLAGVTDPRVVMGSPGA